MTGLLVFPGWLLARRRRVLACCAIVVIAGSILPWTYFTHRVSNDVIVVGVTPGVAWTPGKLTLAAGATALGLVYLSHRRPMIELLLAIFQFTLFALCATIGAYYLLDPALLGEAPGRAAPIGGFGSVRAGVGLLALTTSASGGLVFSILGMSERRLPSLRGTA